MTFHSPRLKCLLIMLPLQGYYSQYTVAIFNDFGVPAECILTAQNKKIGVSRRTKIRLTRVTVLWVIGCVALIKSHGQIVVNAGL